MATDLAAMNLLNQEENTPEQTAEDISKHISTIVSALDIQERTTRDQMLRLWKYLELLWSGSGNYYWDHFTGQWRAITQEDIALLAQDSEVDPTMMNKTINLIRPYGESLAGVLTTGLPRVRYFPKDADNDLDIQASKGYTTVEQKIADDNMMSIKLIEILVKMWNGGFAAAYNYTHIDKKYGTYTEKVMGDRNFDQESLICTQCGNEQVINETEVVEPERPPEDTNEDADLAFEEMQDPEIESQNVEPVPEMPETIPASCPVCGTETLHLASTVTTSKNVQVGSNEVPKSRELINIYGPMHVKFSSLATRREHIYWLILEEELDVAYARSLYPESRDKITASSSSFLDVDRMNRSQHDIGEDTLAKAATIRKVWLKPAAFEHLPDVKDIEALKSQFPNGLMATYCANIFLEAEESDLDDHWTISINPLYNRVMADPLGKALIGTQESANDFYQLEIDAVRFAIPQMFADPAFFDFEAFRQTRSLPGTVTPMKRPPGGKLSDIMAEGGKSTLPQGIEYLDSKIEKLMQFISGILPPIFGGPASGSKTLGEYQEAKNQALQRLSLIWKVVCVMYSEIMAKATKQYVKSLREDEKFVRPNGKNNYMNVWIRRADFEGEIGDVRPELSEQFPMTWGQMSARIMELLGMNNQLITSWFMHPENVELIYQTLGINDLYVPGEDQRNKQLYEIGQVLSQPPTIQDPLTGEEIPNPTIQPIMIQPIDDHVVHAAVTAAFLNSSIGLDLQKTNPVAYMIIMEHFQAHQAQAALMREAQAQAEKENSSDSSEQVEEASA